MPGVFAIGDTRREVSEFFGRVGSDNDTFAGRGDCVLGEVRLTAGAVGVGVPAQGQILEINQNEGLFALLGFEFGGNGQTNFALPDLSGLAPNGLTYTMCIEGLFPSRS